MTKNKSINYIAGPELLTTNPITSKSKSMVDHAVSKTKAISDKTYLYYAFPINVNKKIL